LLIDDHADTRDMYAVALEDAGDLVLHTATGAEASRRRRCACRPS